MDKILRLDRGQIEVVDDDMAEVLKNKTPAERIRIANNLWASAHNMLMSLIGKIHPEWDIERIKKEVARRLSHGTA